MTDKIEHITLTTGASRISERSEVRDDVVTAVRTAIADQGGKVRDWTIQIIGSPAGGHMFDLLWQGRRVVRCWLCDDQRVSQAMWSGVSLAAPAGTRLHPPSTVPWLAAAIVPEAASVPPEALMMVGDMERCVAWAILE